MESKHGVTHEQIIDRVAFVARLAYGVLAGLGVLGASMVGSCMATRDLVNSHETKISRHEGEIASLRQTDERVTDTLRQIHGSVERIAGALGVHRGAK